MRNYSVKRFALAAAVFMVAVGLLAFAQAGSLREGSSAGSAATGALPGPVLWTYYETTEAAFPCPGPDPSDCNHGGNGDNILNLVNPNGSANANLGGNDNSVCAMIYVFDDDQEMGECCGCPLTPAQLATFSVENNLMSNWGLSGGPEAGAHGHGAIAIVATAQNPALIASGLDSNGQSCTISQSGACNFGCDPTNLPGYRVTAVDSLLGSITHNQIVQAGPLNFPGAIVGLTELGLFDDGGGDPTNLIYLQNQCGALVGDGSGGGICNCSAAGHISFVRILTPAFGAIVSGTVPITVTESANVSSDKIFIDSVLFATSPPLTANFDTTTVPNGPHTISATGYASNGAVLGSDSVTVSVQNATATATASLTPTATPTETFTVPTATATPTSTATTTATETFTAATATATPTATPTGVAVAAPNLCTDPSPNPTPGLGGSLGNYAVLAGSTVTSDNTGGNTQINGNLGVFPGGSTPGFPTGMVTGFEDKANSNSNNGQNILTLAITAAKSPSPQLIATELANTTLVAGAYTSASGTFQISTGTLTLDAQGNPAAVWIFQMGTTLNTAVGSSIQVINGGSACNIFWQVGSSATLLGSSFEGNILASQSISLGDAVTVVQGRLLASVGAVTFISDTVNGCSCPGQ
jgi:hypothetical protein